MTFEEKRDEAARLHWSTTKHDQAELDFIVGADWAKQELGWQPIDTCPSDVFVLMGLWVNKGTFDMTFEAYIFKFVRDDHYLMDIDGAQSSPWEPEDFEYWQTISEPPANSEAHSNTETER